MRLDLGIVNIATTSDGEIMAGRELNRIRVRERKLRGKLGSRSMWWPRLNAPVAGSPWKS
ncbi:hypothetical protein [Streptomyces sp. TRM70350]|uniref:hypothetical protein n=1 Tax=Streptomyces sp. TRM70350 TaxID=2856165 RepID=UPI0027E1E0AF|nr:hypothetical protein [Streptomyces sp. TRM70350]